jgi:putative thioredoxin
MSVRYQLAVFKFENNEYEEAIRSLLEMIVIDRNWQNKSAQTFLIYIFNYLGADNPLTIEGRKQMTKILY